MNEIELKARELLKAECPHLQDEAFEYGSMMTVINLHVVMRALRAAFTPPEGYVLVPVDVQQDAKRFRWLKSCSREQYLIARGVFGLADDVIDAGISIGEKEASNSQGQEERP